jgi:hypothetical protein
MLTPAMPLAVAEYVAKWRVTDDLQAQFDHFAEKSSAGTLTPEEAKEYSELIDALNAIAIFQARARLVLKQSKCDDAGAP